MKPRFSNQRNQAMTLVEVLVVIVTLAVLAIVFLPAIQENNVKNQGWRINCVNNLKEIGLAYKLWSDDHNGKFPMEISATNGDTMELVVNGKNAWLNYLVMSNELYTPKLLICPADANRHYATNFSTDLAGKISYFVGLDASTNFPQAFLSGDDNFEIGGVPVKSGLSEFSTNDPISWTAARHKFVGNIGLADGSVQMVNNSGLTNLLHQTGLATNRLAIP